VSVTSVLHSLGGVASARALAARGVTRRQLEAALRAGAIERIRRGWYRGPGAPSSVVLAVSAGGVLTCGSALELQGVWMLPDSRVHVRVARGVSLVRSEGLVVHWSDRRAEPGFPMDPVPDAIQRAVSCLDLRAAVVAMDSALNRRLISRAQLEAMCASARGRRLLRLVDGASESGLETIARLALRRWRVKVRTQVPIAGVGRVDLLIGDRLVLELDGQGWHDRPGDFESDRARDRALVAAGYLPMRASYRQVLTEWGAVEQQLLQVIRAGRHRWPRTRA
jgi:very-short-patch-repair endonuclease